MIDYTEPTVSREIDGYIYTHDKPSATAALKLAGRVAQVAGPSGLKAIVQRYASGFAEAAPSLVVAAGAELNPFGALIQASYGLQQDPDLPRDLVAGMKVDRVRPAGAGGTIGDRFDAHFAGELPHLFRVCEFALVHTFLGFTLGRPFPSGALTSPAAVTDASFGSPSPSAGSSATPESPTS